MNEVGNVLDWFLVTQGGLLLRRSRLMGNSRT